MCAEWPCILSIQIYWPISKGSLETIIIIIFLYLLQHMFVLCKSLVLSSPLRKKKIRNQMHILYFLVSWLYSHLPSVYVDRALVSKQPIKSCMYKDVMPTFCMKTDSHTGPDSNLPHNKRVTDSNNNPHLSPCYPTHKKEYMSCPAFYQTNTEVKHTANLSLLVR